MTSTDNHSELFDIVDENDNVIGQATRREVHTNKNLIHRSIGVLVFNSKGELLMQERSATKDTDPLKWTISCSGHVMRNKPIIQSSNHPINKKMQNLSLYEKTAHRELIEELGIDIPIEFVMKFLCRAPHETEMQSIFRGESDGPFRFHQKEIRKGRFFSKEELRKLLKNKKIEVSIMGTVVLEKIQWIIENS